jgi:hypothetical protein
MSLSPVAPSTAADRLSRIRAAIAAILDPRWLVFYCALLGGIFTVAVYYPGYMSPDSVAQLQQARFGVNSNVYPPLMDYIWAVTDRIIPGPAGMLLLHSAVFWWSVATIAYVVTRRLIARLVFVAVAGFWPPTFAMLGTIWKDVGMQVFLFAALACLLSAAYMRRLWPLAPCGVFLFIAGGYRHNAVAAAVPLLVLIVIETVRLLPERAARLHAWLQERGLMWVFRAALGGALLLTFSVALEFVNFYDVADAKLWSAAMVNDLAGLSVAQNINYLPPYVNSGGVTVDDLKRMYSPLHANSLFDPGSRKYLRMTNPLPDKAITYHLTDAQAADWKLRWLTALLDNPGSYLRNRFTLTAELLVLDTYHPWYPYVMGIDPNPFGLSVKPSRLTSLVSSVINYGAFQTPLWSAWAYYVFLAGCLFVSVLWDFVHARIVQMLVISAFLYLVSIILFGMSGDFRYNIWGLSCCYICPLLLARGRRRLERSADGILPDKTGARPS